MIFTIAKYNYNISISLAFEIKKSFPSVKIFFGGFFAAGNYELILSKYQFVDACFLSEGEETLLSVLNNIDNNTVFYENVNRIAYYNLDSKTINKIFIPTEQIELNTIPSPYEEIIDPVVMNRQYGCIYVSASRGCKFACSYCYHPLIRKKIRHFAIEKIIKEILNISNKFKKYESILIDFWDDFFISDRDYTINLCKQLIAVRKELGCEIKIKVDTRIDFIDEQLLEYMKQANFYFIGFGLENTNPLILQEMKKLGTEATKENYIDFLSRFAPILKNVKN